MAKVQTEEQWITDGELAKIIGVSRTTIYRWYKFGPEPGANFDIRDCEPLVCGRVRRWPLSSVMACLTGKLRRGE